MGKRHPRYNAKARASSHLNPRPIPADAANDNSDASTDPAGPKMTAKKRKRLEAYIAKKLKKEERVDLFQKLSHSSFESELLKSSARIGQKHDTAKDKLRRALHEERLGFQRSDPSVRLTSTVMVPSIPLEKPIEEIKSDSDPMKTESKPLDLSSPIAGSALKSFTPQVVTFNHTKTEITDNIQPVPVYGSALKRKAADDESLKGSELSAKKKSKKNKKKKSTVSTVQTVVNSSDSDSDSGSEKESAFEIERDVTHSKADDSPLGGSNLEQIAQIQSTLKLATVSSSVKKDSASQNDCIAHGGPKSSKKAFYVVVQRDPEIQAQREALPIYGEEQQIMETINNHAVTIICGETGSGKTTQIPQFLYEAGYGHPDSDNPGIIGITQPRRVAAVSTSQRVAQELNTNGSVVSYQIRYDTTVSSNTVIKFMTDGILLKEILSDFLLTKYSIIILDEAHERNLNTDVLIGLLSRIVRLRAKMAEEWVAKYSGKDHKEPKEGRVRPLKLVIMSATLRVQDFTENRNLFDDPPPIINVEARQYPVNIHFNRRTPHIDHVTEAYNKICKIHSRLPKGGILVFLTGQNEIQSLVKKLRKKYPIRPQSEKKPNFEGRFKALSANSHQIDLDSEDVTNDQSNPEIDSLDFVDPIDDDDSIYDLDSDSDSDSEADSDSESVRSQFSDDLLFSSDSDDEEDSPDLTVAPLHVLPLYSLLPTHEQLKVFQNPPEGTRLCVIATNVAETSLTIPGVKYVVDCGKAKERQYDPLTSIQSHVVTWTSQSSAAQRSGRAGRTGPGHCYRLYSSAVFDNMFPQFSKPEILKVPIEGVVLILKTLGVEKVSNFPFITKPELGDVKNAEKMLVWLGALSKDNQRITELGKTMSQFPVHPRFSKMLILGHQYDLLQYMIAIVAALSVGDPFLRDILLTKKGDKEDGDDSGDEDSEEIRSEKEQNRKLREKWYKVQQSFTDSPPTSDVLKLLTVVGAFEYSGGTESFCRQNFLRYKSMLEIRNLRKQLTTISLDVFPSSSSPNYADLKMAPPNPKQKKLLRQIILAGFADQVAMVSAFHISQNQFSKNRRLPFQTLKTAPEEAVYIHQSSCLNGVRDLEAVVYLELFKSSAGGGNSVENLGVVNDEDQKKENVSMKTISSIEASWLPKVAKGLCSFGKPVESPAPRYNPSLDTITCYCHPSIRLSPDPSAPEFALPLTELPISETLPSSDAALIEECRHFGKELLEGNIIPAFKVFGESNRRSGQMRKKCGFEYTTKPNVLVKSKFINISKVSEMVKTLVKENVNSKKKLLEVWSKSPKFLLPQFLQWVPAEIHPKVRDSWPPVENSFNL
ncbi:P-loop containing nucleoside triphosphate hydrolase protein [Paraphysoderma sedebokerense]|nr:P-loop containing nucleoside triphosphate hydrolase protein [Paraphysoderma sedebokerense]